MTYHSGNHLLDPQSLFEKVGLHEGMHVADLGCGRTGHIIFPASQVVGGRGIVYAVDILKDVLEAVHRRAALEGLLNVQTIWADIGREGGIAIPKKTLDIGFFINVLYHFTDYDTPLSEVSALLREKGRIVVVDWVTQLSTLGPKAEERVDFDRIESWGREHGFVVQHDGAAGPYHRCMILFRQM